MEILLICFAVAFMATGKFQKDTAQAAYKAGKEPPGLQKARMRHERGGARHSPKTGKPKGPGSTRMIAATKWGHACEKAKDRMEDRHRRWRAWYQEQAPQRDQQWREKQQRRLEKRGQRLDKWQSRWTQTKDTLNPAARAREDEAWQRNAEPDQDSPAATGEADESDESDEAAAAAPGVPETDEPGEADTEPAETEHTAADQPSPAGAAATQPDSNTNLTEGGATVYDQAAQELNNHGDEAEGYQQALAQLGDEMGGAGWGAEVHAPLSEMHTQLAQVAGRYRDLAEQIKHQGDQVNDAYDEAPWAPDKHALVQQ